MFALVTTTALTEPPGLGGSCPHGYLASGSFCTPRLWRHARGRYNPETNVVNSFGFAHEVPNLGVLGASVIGASCAHNPTLTAQGLAWRTAEHLSKKWKRIAN
jgi:hypothetical protein